ncbi:MAG: PepSY-associated TM helix domain-containing protein [Gammaproteobacteria bacterium]|nr:PepSY-associated TM helix domain-containing protein [Gammaproteobacteria bacterium]
MRVLHIFSAMPVLLLMLFFAVTGLILNHPDWDKTRSHQQQMTVPRPAWLMHTKDWQKNHQQQGLRLLQWFDLNHDIRATRFSIEWDDFDLR